MENQQPFNLNEAAIAVHELFDSYLHAGFSRNEAIELVKIHLSSLLTANQD